jgi:hypothetical protein
MISTKPQNLPHIIKNSSIDNILNHIFELNAFEVLDFKEGYTMDSKGMCGKVSYTMKWIGRTKENDSQTRDLELDDYVRQLSKSITYKTGEKHTTLHERYVINDINDFAMIEYSFHIIKKILVKVYKKDNNPKLAGKENYVEKLNITFL